MTAGQIEYRNYLHSWRWWAISSTRRMWDGNRCRTCGEKRGLNVHHSSYVHRGEFGIVGMTMEWLDTITLCSECHSRIHENRSVKDFAD